MDEVECTSCLAEPAAEEGKALLDGWIEGEYGWTCPGCLLLEAAPGQTAGIAAVAEAVAASPKKGS